MQKKENMDYLLLNNMVFFAFHGVTEQETKVGNTFIIDLKIGGDFSKACKSDKIEDAINYASVYDEVKIIMTEPCKLLEHLAHKICTQLKQSFKQIEVIEIKLSKINPPIFGQVESASVILTR